MLIWPHHHLPVPFYFNRISGWHSLDELPNISEKTELHWENHIFSAFPAPQVAMTPAMVLEPVTTDMETLFLHFYTYSTQIWKHCFCAAARSTCGYLFGKSVLHTIRPHCRDLPPSTHVEQKPRNPRREFNLSEMELQIKSVTTEVNNLTGPL